jgi:DeoR/GlpR family transcriptional regulator of sugar metabolism
MTETETSIPGIRLKEERQRLIRELVDAVGRATVPDLSLRFGVSEATIRRDLEDLRLRGRLHRAHGGAVRLEHAGSEPPMLDRAGDQAEAKRRIGRLAAAMIQDGETIFLGSGTTVYEVAQALPPGQPLTVITNSLPIANRLADRPQVQLIVIGGMFRPSELSMIGHIAEQAIRELRADRAFIGMRSIDAAAGFTHEYLPEIMTDRAILGMAAQVVIVADHTKLGRLSPVAVAPVTVAHVIITDRGAPGEAVAELRQRGLDVRLV